MDVEFLSVVADELAALNVGLTFEPAVEGAGYDADLTISVDGTARRFAAEIGRRVTEVSAGAARDDVVRRVGADGVLVLPYVSPRLAGVLRDLGQHFIDSAGNAYLSGPGLRIWQVGRRPLASAERSVEPRSGGAALQIQFTLLARPELATQPMRVIADASGASLGSVQTTMTLLDRQGHFARVAGHRVLVDRMRLLDTWTTLFLQLLRPRLLLGRFTGLPAGQWEATALPKDAQWGGEVAAAVLTGYLRPQVATIYAPAIPREFVARHRLRKATSNDTNGIVEVRRRFWRWGDAEVGGVVTVPPLLVYADLLAVADARCVEVAGRIRDEFLAPALEVPTDQLLGRST